ncbi:hypothetical protein [Wohlfahrtiimonas larvae]|uniref:Uncharacterized protein n=1 Tax=Wohlfahrtiimonas larvae TaxID=1157986 RepID=A0ABP9MS96_9GAMM|nr:hypothetical protein [Wohlfahrtiimonas larvae]
MMLKKLTLTDTNNNEIRLVRQSFNLSNLNDLEWYYDDLNSRKKFPNEDNIWDQFDQAKVGSIIYDKNKNKLYTVKTRMEGGPI